MRALELLRLVVLNISQNKFKSVMTSIGIVAGAATIVLVIGIGRGGQMDVAEQFAQLNAGAIDVSYDYSGEEKAGQGDGFSFGKIGKMFGTMFGGSFGGNSDSGGSSASGSGSVFGGRRSGGGAANGTDTEGMEGTGNSFSENGRSVGGAPDSANVEEAGSSFPGGGMPGNGFRENAGGEDAASGSNVQGNGTAAERPDEEETETGAGMIADRLNQENIILTQSDVEDIERYVPGISGVTISYSTRASVEGGNLTSAQTYTVAGVKESYEPVNRLTMSEGSFIMEEDDDIKNKICVLGAAVAEELFGSGDEITGSTLYIEDRAYIVAGVLEQTLTVASGISPDSTIFIPYETGIKYVTGGQISPVITVIAENVDVLDTVIEAVKTVLGENYENTVFTFEDSGNKMQAAQSSNRTLTMLLSAMAVIVFLIGGIGIMNVLFVSVRERTNEIGILKAIGTPRSEILAEFLLESAAISCIGGVLGVALSFGVMPVVERFDVRIEMTIPACAAAMGFAVLTGTIFGIYPAWKASRMEPVDALNEE